MNTFNFLVTFIPLLIGPLLFFGYLHVTQWEQPSIGSFQFWRFHKVISVLIVFSFIYLTFFDVLINPEAGVNLITKAAIASSHMGKGKGYYLVPFVFLPSWSLCLTLFPHVVSNMIFKRGLFVNRLPNWLFIASGHLLYSAMMSIYALISVQNA